MKQVNCLLLILVLTLCATCSLDTAGSAGPVFTVKPTFELINQTDDLSTFSRALNRSGLDSALIRANVFTVFAPTNDAWDAAGIDVETMDSTELNNLIRYHLILNVAIGRSAIQEGEVYLNTANIESPDASAVMMFLDRTANVITLNNETRIVGNELLGTNAIIHPVDMVLHPPTVMDLLEGNPNLSRFASLFAEAEGLADGVVLTDSLRQPGPFTVFAPINENLPENTYTAEEKRTVALYHIVGGRSFRFEDFTPSFTTLQGDGINLFDRSVVTSSSQSLDLQFENIQGTNGVVHLVSGLMLPEGF